MQLQIQQRLEGANPVVVATLNDFSPLPHGNVFIYENNGDTTLGDYVGVASLDEYLSLNVWTGQAEKVSVVRFLNYDVLFIHENLSSP